MATPLFTFNFIKIAFWIIYINLHYASHEVTSSLYLHTLSFFCQIWLSENRVPWATLPVGVASTGYLAWQKNKLDFSCYFCWAPLVWAQPTQLSMVACWHFAQGLAQRVYTQEMFSNSIYYSRCCAWNDDIVLSKRFLLSLERLNG